MESDSHGRRRWETPSEGSFATRAAAILALAFVVACEGARPETKSGVAPRDEAQLGPGEGPVVPASAPVRRLPGPADPVAACERRAREITDRPGHSVSWNDPELRARLLPRAKAEPVVFLREPQFSAAGTPGIEARRVYLRNTRFPLDGLRAILKNFDGMPLELRQILLRDGYLVVEHPESARELSMRVTLEDLFAEPSLTILRGSEYLSVTRDKKGKYLYATGEQRGQRATVLLWDRVWPSDVDIGRPLHVDLRRLKSEEGFDDLALEHLTDEGAVALLDYGGERVRGVLRFSAPNVELDCLLASDEQLRVIEAARRRARGIGLLRAAMAAQIREGLPFDEPKTEVGQEDGKLREHWTNAYLAGRKTYTFRGDRYRVFDELGHPLEPQVCVDFITETLERGSGRRLAPEGEPPVVTLGALDFTTLLGPFERRREMAIREFARREESGLRLVDVSENERIPYERVNAFFGDLAENRGSYRVGDIVVIRGRAKWDFYAEIHTHTFFVFETDPVSGVPIVLAGNSGKPRLVTWDAEMLRAPKRSIQHRISLGPAFLERFLGGRLEEAEARYYPSLTLAEQRQ